jgi:hypothetical protein
MRPPIYGRLTLSRLSSVERGRDGQEKPVRISGNQGDQGPIKVWKTK